MNTIRASFAGLAGPSVEVPYGKGISVEKFALEVADALGVASNYAFRLEDRKGNVITDIAQLKGKLDSVITSNLRLDQFFSPSRLYCCRSLQRIS